MLQNEQTYQSCGSSKLNRNLPKRFLVFLLLSLLGASALPFNSFSSFDSAHISVTAISQSLLFSFLCLVNCFFKSLSFTSFRKQYHFCLFICFSSLLHLGSISSEFKCRNRNYTQGRVELHQRMI